MALLNYQARFAPFVESLEKRQTIRALRKRPVEIGEMLHHYTGCRTKAAWRLLPPMPCMLAVTLRMRWAKHGRNGRRFDVIIHGRRLTRARLEDLARADGFPDVKALAAFFLPPGREEFIGQLIQW